MLTTILFLINCNGSVSVSACQVLELHTKTQTVSPRENAFLNLEAALLTEGALELQMGTETQTTGGGEKRACEKKRTKSY